MSNRLKVTLLALIVAGGGAWYAFRPERLFINQKVNEQFPTASAASNQLASGQFHSGAHETKGMATVFQLADGKKTLRLTNFETSNGPDVHVYLVAAHRRQRQRHSNKGRIRRSRLFERKHRRSKLRTARERGPGEVSRRHDLVQAVQCELRHSAVDERCNAIDEHAVTPAQTECHHDQQQSLRRNHHRHGRGRRHAGLQTRALGQERSFSSSAAITFRVKRTTGARAP